MSGGSLCDGLCDAQVGLLDVIVVVDVCVYVEVVEKSVKSRLEGEDIVVCGFAVEFGGLLARPRLSSFYPDVRCDQSVVGVQSCRMVCGDVLKASSPLSAADEEV